MRALAATRHPFPDQELPELYRLWVKSGHQRMSASCPLYPQKRTWISTAVMSALCQKQTLARMLDMRAQTLAQKDYVSAPGMKQRIRVVPNLSI